MKKVIIFSRYYKPGYKAGGPIRSVENILKIFGKKYNFLLVTGDRDLDQKAYKNISFNKILSKKNCKLLYLSKNRQNITEFRKIISLFNPDAIYLNSFFDFKFSILINLINKMFFNKKTYISPRGELFKSAIKSKFFKKKTFIFISKLLNLYSNTIFFVNSKFEKKSLKNLSIKNLQIKIYPVFTDNSYRDKKKILKKVNTNLKKMRILFVGRIIENKNLLYCFSILEKLTFKVEFSIIGPIENHEYWAKCENKINQLHKNVTVKFLGAKSPQFISEYMRRSHCLLHPSKFESYGHVILESFSNGLPVLISNETPWFNLKKRRLGANINLSNLSKFLKKMIKIKKLKKKNFLSLRKKILKYYNSIVEKNNKYLDKKIF